MATNDIHSTCESISVTSTVLDHTQEHLQKKHQFSCQRKELAAALLRTTIPRPASPVHYCTVTVAAAIKHKHPSEGTCP